MLRRVFSTETQRHGEERALAFYFYFRGRRSNLRLYQVRRRISYRAFLCDSVSLWWILFVTGN